MSASKTATATAKVSRENAKIARELLKEQNECMICIEPMNKSTRKRVECGSCDYSACRECYKHYLLNTNDNPHCMGCKGEWNQVAMIDKFDKSFVNTGYKQHREDVLVDRERSKMVATQPYVEQILLNRVIRKDIEKMETEKRAIDVKIQELHSNIKTYNPRTAVEKKQFIRKCMGEDCKGFLSSQWKCGMCNHWSCPDCHVVIGLERGQEVSGIVHECNADTLATAKLLDSDTKMCPKCSTGIFKIDGCDMMFCVECHTSFSWKTGKIETGHIHNPHYFEWLRNGGQTVDRNPDEVRCGREMDHYFVERIQRKFRSERENISSNVRDCLTARARFIIHTRAVNMVQFGRMEGYEDNLDLRIQFMLNKLSDEEFKKRLQQREKQNAKKQEYLNIVGMFVNCQTEIFYRIDNMIDTTANDMMQTQIDALVNESDRLMEYTNECLKNISKTYSSTKYHFEYNFELKSR